MNTEILEENLLPSLVLTQLCSLALSFVGSLVVTYLGNEDRLLFFFLTVRQKCTDLQTEVLASSFYPFSCLCRQLLKSRKNVAKIRSR